MSSNPSGFNGLGRWRKAGALLLNAALFSLLALNVAHAVPAENKDFKIGPAPDWVLPMVIDEGKNAQESKASQGVYWLLSDFQVRIDGEGATTYRHSARKALNEQGVETAAHVDIEFNPAYQSLQLHTLLLHRNGQTQARIASSTIRVLKRERELEYRLYDGRKSVVITLNDVRPGDIVEYSYSTIGTNPVFGNRKYGRFELQYGVPVEHSFRRLVFPLGRNIAVHQRNMEQKPSITEVGGFRDHRWEARAVPALLTNSDAPSWFDPYPMVYWSEFRDWAAVVNWAYPYYQPPRTLSGDLRNEIARIGNVSSDVRERILGVLRFVQGDVRYLGIEIGPGSHAPRSPNDVFARRFGDCKDKTFLVVTMLRALGIEAQAALVSTELQQNVREQPPSPGAFNHVIVHVKLSGVDHWFDPTRARQEADFANIVQPDFGYALLIGRGSSDFTPMANPTTRANKKAVVAFLDARESDTKPASLTVTTLLAGNAAESMRGKLAVETRESIQKTYLDFYIRYYPKIVVANPLTVLDEKGANQITVTEQYDIPNFWRRDEGKKRREASAYVSEVLTYLRRPEIAGRNSPFALGNPIDFTQTTDIRLPKIKWSFNPKKYSVNDPAFDYQRQVLFDGGDLLSITDHFQSKTSFVALRDVSKFAANINQARDNLDYDINWYDPGTGSSSKKGFNWTVAMFALLLAVILFGLARKVNRYDPPLRRPMPTEGPVGIGGWMLIPGSGIYFGPFKIIIDGLDALPSYSLQNWVEISSMQRASFNAGHVPFLLLELAGSMTLLVFWTLLLLAFSQKRRLAPYLFVGLAVSSVLFGLLDMGLGSLIPAVAAKVRTRDVAMLGIQGASAVIWCAYFMKSKRVKRTFVESYRPIEFDPKQPTEHATPG